KVLCNDPGSCSFNDFKSNFNTNVYARTIQLAGEGCRVFEREEILHARSTAIEGVGAEAQSLRAGRKSDRANQVIGSGATSAKQTRECQWSLSQPQDGRHDSV